MVKQKKITKNKKLAQKYCFILSNGVLLNHSLQEMQEQQGGDEVWLSKKCKN